MTHCQATMITRRRGSIINTVPLEVEVADALETVECLPSPVVEFPTDSIDTSGIELDDLFGIEGWTLERESPVSDMELADLGIYCAKDRDFQIEASTASSPERMSSHLKIKNKQNQSASMINKNAIAARLNRLKKKEYVNSLEKKVGILSTENNALKEKNSQLTNRVEELENETRGLTQTTTTMPYQGSA